MTIHEASEKYNIPIKILRGIRKLGIVRRSEKDNGIVALR